MTTYARPETLSDALSLRAEGGWTVAAGCTDLFPATEAKALPGAVLDITAIPSLRRITRDGDLRIGATATWTDILRADLPPALDGLKAAAREVGSIQIQNAGAVGGNLCNASPAADGVPPLLTLDAEVELTSAAATRRLALSDFITGVRRTALADDEILTAILIPERALSGRGAFTKLGARRYLVISIAMAALRLELRDGVVATAALAVGACSAVATRLRAVEDALSGHPPDPSLIRDADILPALSPISDLRADADYRAAAAGALARRLLAEARAGAAGSRSAA